MTKTCKESYYCKACNYHTMNKYDFNKHCKRKKHLTNQGLPGKNSTAGFNATDERNHKCEMCGKCYKFASGLSRHKMKCHDKNSLQLENGNLILEKQNQHICALHTMIEKTIEKQNSTIHHLLEKLGTHQNITNNYNHTTINVFLNQHCKDAMNMTDFINSLSISMEDFEYTIDNGYAKGIINILLKRLVDMSPTQRPIHCSNRERLLFHVKEHNIWEEDKKHERIEKSIDAITQRQIQMIKKWECENPNWNNSENGTECYMNMVRELMGGISDEEKDNKYAIIKKELGINMDIKSII